MIRGSFRSAADQELLAELRANSRFRQYVDKLRTAHTEAVANMTYTTPQELQTAQGYVRCLSELLKEITGD